MAGQTIRVEKLEAACFGDLTPEARVRAILEAHAEGHQDLARRIAQACPHKTYRMSDAEYADRLDDAYAVCGAAVATFERYAFAIRQIEEVRDALAEPTTALTCALAGRWGSLRACVRVEWLGFDRFCRSELHLDAWTLLRGFDAPQGLQTWLHGVVSTEEQPDEENEHLADLAVECEATWRTAFHKRQGKHNNQVEGEILP